MGETSDMFRRMKFGYHNSYCFKPKYAASIESKIELLMLVSAFMVNSVLKNTQRYFCGIYGMS